MTVIIEELSFLAMTYHRLFTFNLDGTAYENFESQSLVEGEGVYQIFPRCFMMWNLAA